MRRNLSLGCLHLSVGILFFFENPFDFLLHDLNSCELKDRLFGFDNVS